MKTSLILPRTKSLMVVAYLLTLCLAGGISLLPSFGASLSIPGTVSVTIQPAEAIAAGARWSIDGGALQASGASASGLVPGTHTIQFNNLAAWREPDTAQVLVIGGKPVTLTATYQPLPRFYFRTVPEQRARIGTSVEFLVHTDDPGDPQNPGPGMALQLEATPPPSGPLVFDAPSGRIAYTPSVGDHLPFTVRLTTPQGLAGSFEMTPINTLAPEESVIEYDRPLPNAESRDYMQISEVPNAPELFNDAMAETFTVSISGQTLVFAVDHPAHLHRQYSGRFNLRSLRLYADKVIIRSPLVLPQTQVTIQARELRFEGDGRIETTPRARVRVPPGAGPTASGAQSGDSGHDGGNVNVFVERFFSDSTTSTRLVMRGGTGGPAGQGRNGLTENDLVAQVAATNGFLSVEWYALMGRSGNTVCGAGSLSEVMLYYEERFNNVVQDICGSRPSTAFGESAVYSGVPGRGGNGGTLRSTMNLSAFAQLDGGVPGARGASYVGAAAPTRRFIYRVTNTRIVNGDEVTSTSDTTAPKAAGSNATAPFGSSGFAGSMQVMPNPGVWLHSFSLRSIVQFAKDAYLNGRIADTRQLLGEYQQLLRAHERIVGPNEQLTDEEFAENVNLDQLLAEVENLIHRLDSNLDYFGNPAGWVPMLSFEANFFAFQNEVDHAIPILYLTYWLNNAATNLQASLAATEQAKDNLEDERTRLETAFNEAQSNLPRLKSEAATIAFQITTFQRQLTNKLAQLEQKARDNVAERNKLPLWKKGLGILSVAADLVPIGQPTVGRIGAGIGLLAKIDPDHPIESAKALKPEAFGVMSNKNISVCFGTNAPSNTSTNSGGSTNDVKKAKQERLKRLTECAKFLGAELKEVAGIFKEAQVDSKDLAAELEKLKASDTEFQELILQLQVLNVDKERYAQQLAAALQVIGSFSAGLAENLVATHELEDRITANLNALDHGALMHIKEMERRTRDRLVQYQYYLAKSFQYRQLRPFTGNLQLTRLFTRFQQLVEANTSHILSPDEFDNLKGIFVDELREMVAQSLDNVNAPSRSFPKTYRLNVDQRRQLNQQGYLVLNLKDLGLINPGDENVRLADLRTRTLTVTPTGPIGSLALVRVNYEHLGTSRLTTGGRTFLFRHYQTENANPITWNAIYDAHTGQTVNSTLSAAQQSLISVLLALQPVPVTNLLFFSQPAANAEILLTKDVSSDNGTGFMIDDLLFEIQYDFNATSGSLREMNMRVSGDLAPTIYVSPADINNRADGVGDFSRVYGSFQVVTLQAPSTYGRYAFDKWMLNNQPYTTFPATAIVLSANMQVEARYRLPAIPVLAMAAAPRGQIRFNIPSETGSTYILEQSPRLNNPTWSAVDTRSGDGTTLEFTRTTTSPPNMFYRVRIDRQ